MRHIALILSVVATPLAADPFVLVQSTTSTQNSGLYDHILPIFTETTGIEVRVVAVGTGQALKNAANCDGDVVIVHAPEAETAFVAAGYGVERFPLMYNDFIIVGPPEDSASISGLGGAEALTQLAQAEAAFVSRGDDSGTHRKEQSLWEAAGVDPLPGSGDWYLETGSGMGAALNVAVGMGAHALTDRATWLAYENKRGFEVLVEGDPTLFNPYGIIAVNPEHCPRVRADEASAFIGWMLSEPGQTAIASYTLGGEQLFVPDAR